MNNDVLMGLIFERAKKTLRDRLELIPHNEWCHHYFDTCSKMADEFLDEGLELTAQECLRIRREQENIVLRGDSKKDRY